MEITIIKKNKKEFLDLLLLADEEERMIDMYLDRGTLFALYDGELRSICVVTDEGHGEYELQNLATYEQFQGQGYAKKLINHIANYYKGQDNRMVVGTGDIPWILSFYESCGFVFSHRLENYFIEHCTIPMFDGDIRLKDKVYLNKNLA